MKMLLGFAPLLLLQAFIVPPSLSAQQQSTTLYVNRTNPTCAGQSPCFSTIQAAINAATPGNDIQIQAGTYAEQLSVTGKNNFQGATESDRITIEADPALQPGQVVLTGKPGACTANHAIRLQQSKYITIRGLTITGTGGQAISLLGGNNQNRDVHIELNRIFGNGSSSCNGGITVAQGNPGTLIVNNLIYANGRNAITFIDADGGPHYVINNTIYGNQWNGVDVARNHTITLANNIINSNGTAAGTTGGRFGVRRESSTTAQPAGIKLLNNLVCGNTQGQITTQVLDSTDSSNFTPLGGEGTGVGALTGCDLPANLFGNLNGADSQPNTVDDDFSLKANSLAIDVGMDPRTFGFNPSYNPIFEADFVIEGIRPADGNSDRLAAFDAGAFEFPNGTPIANAGVDQTGFRRQLVTLNGSASSDPEGASLTFAWTVISQPTGSSVSLVGASTANPNFTPLVLGEYIIRLVVNDGQLASEPDTVKVTIVNRAPTANAGGPYSANVNAPIQFAGSGADPDGDAITFLWNFGDGGTATAPNPTHAYAAGGTYTVTLTVTDAFSASAVAQTTATIDTALTLNPIGNKIVNLGQTLTFTVTATNPGGGPVRLYVAPLPLMTNATFNASTGVFTFRPDITQIGTYQLTFTAASGVNSVSQTITVTVPNPPPGGTTAVRGLVHNLNNTPLANVRVMLRSSGHTALTGTDGFFTLAGIPSGTQQLIVNGREANLGVYAIIAVAVDLIEGVLNDLSGAISLPDVDIETEVQVSQTFNTVVANPSLPGVELEIIGGSATNPDGTPFTGKLSINPVPDYGRPESRPEELRPGFAVTIQPAGIRFNPPARITFPNADGMAPNNELNLWSLSPDTGKFNVVGKSAVSADGQSIITVEGGVTASAWHFPLASSTTSNPSQGSNFCGSCRTSVGSEANLEEGSLFITHTVPSYRSLGQSRSLSLTYSSVTADPRPIISLDSTLSVLAAVPNTFSTRLKVGGVQQGGEIFTDSRSLPEDVDSTSRISVQFDGLSLATGRYPFEATVFSNYLNSSIGGISNGNLIVVNRSNSALGAGWAISDLQVLHFQSAGGVLLTSGDGTALFFSGGPDTFTSPVREFSVLARNPDGTYTRTYKDGTKVNFNAQGLQISVIDRNANATSFGHDGSGRLTTVTDPVGLVTTLAYVGAKLQTIADPAGRQTLFQYDPAGNLTRITNPDASFVTYSYDTNRRMTQATNERGLSTTYAYDYAGRFSQSTRPGGETRALVSSKLRGLVDTASGQGTPTNPAPIVPSSNATASITDGRANQSRFTLDFLGQVISQTDAHGQTTTTVRDANGLPTRITRPNAAVTTMTYDSKGNLLTSTDPVGAITTFTYEPIFNQVKTIRDPKGNLTTINYDVKGNPIEIIDALNNRTQMTYDSRGLLTSVTSAVGTSVQTTTSFAYDTRGNLLSTTNPKGDVTILAYDNAGNASTSTDAENRVTQFTYDARNRLIAVLDADLKTTQYGYDPKGNLNQVRDAKNQLTTFTYDGLDRVVSATNPLGLTETFAYDGNGNLTSTTNRNGQTITFNYDALNRLINKTRPPTSSELGNQITNYTYDALGNLTRVSNPVVNVLNQYDLANRLVSSNSTTEAAVTSQVTIINQDILIDANNSQFDGRTLQVDGRTLTVDGSHTFANLILINGAVLRHSPATSSTLGKLDVTVTGTLQIDTTSRIDVTGRGFLGGLGAGNPFGRTGMTVGFQAGSSGRSGGSYGGLGGAMDGTANPIYGDFRNPNEPGSGAGTAVSSASAAGNGGGLIRIVAQTIQLDGIIKADGETKSCCEVGGGSGGAIRIDVGTLQGAGQITANGGHGVDAAVGGGGGGGRVAIYYQNASGFDFSRATAFRGIGTGGISFNGEPGTVFTQQAIALLIPTEGETPVVNAQADIDSSLGEPIRVALTEIPQRRIFNPSILNSRSSAIDVSANRYFAMVSEGKVKPFAVTGMLTQGSAGPEILSKTLNPKSVSAHLTSKPLPLTAADLDPIYVYDLNGNRTSMTDPTGLTTYSYDALNRLMSTTNNRGLTTTFSYDALGRRTSLTHANGIATTYQYDVASQLTRLAHQLGTTTVNSFDYTYDKVGNRKSKADSAGTANYTYDTLNRLTQAVNPLPTNPLETFTYDPVGNRTNSNQNGSSTFNQANQLLEDVSFTYQYDNNGNLTRKTPKAPGPFTSYEYDAENKLMRAVTNGTTANYKYDGFGRRVEKEVINVGTTTTRYVYDNEDILLGLDGSNNITARYTHGPGVDEPLIMEKNAQSFYYHADGLGSITELTNQSGSVAQRYTYSSYGKIESQLDPNFAQPYTYTSRELDSETTLYSYRARAYDSQTGRFLQPDPMGLLGDNLYPYVSNSPLNFVDPSGNIVQVLSPDSYVDLGFIGYGVYRILVDNILNDCDNLGENLASLGGDLVGLAIPGLTGVGASIRGAKKAKLVIGKLQDLNPAALESGEFVLDWLNKGSDKLNWKENSKLLREAMSKGHPIRDATVDPITGAQINRTGYLRAERNLLEDRGWTYNPQTRHYYPPSSR